MKIVADENIPYVREAFAGLGDVVTIPGRMMSLDTVRDAEFLLVRSVTKVNRALLDGSSVRFVATATIGEDHIDRGYLADRGIEFASAPGSNAESVAQYLAAALLELAARFDLHLRHLRLGIVGVGNVGSRVLRNARALGLECVLNDPPLARATGDQKYRALDEIFECDLVSLHVPLSNAGPDATFHMADAAFMRRLKPGAILINTSRGPVADGNAVKQALVDNHLRACVLDVWENEPDIDVDLLRRVFIGTPHIAGYSFDGKVNGTRQIYEAACRFRGIEPAWDPSPLLPPSDCPSVTLNAKAPGALRNAVRSVYDIMRDDATMRRLLAVPVTERPRLFDRLRKEYPRRREFSHTRARVIPRDAKLETQLAEMGFRIAED